MAEADREPAFHALSDAALVALRDVVADQNGYVTGFVGIVTFIDGDGDPAYALLVDTDQSTATSVGLASILKNNVTRQSARIFGFDGE